MDRHFDYALTGRLVEALRETQACDLTADGWELAGSGSCSTCRARIKRTLDHHWVTVNNIEALAEYAWRHVLMGDNYTPEEAAAQIASMNEGRDMTGKWIITTRDWHHAASVALSWVWVRNYGRGYYPLG